MDEPRADMAGEDVARAVTTAGHSLGKRRRGRRGLSLILVMVAGAGLLMRATPAAFSAPLSQAPTPAPGPTALPTLEQLQLQIQAAKLVLEGIGLQGKNDLQGALDRYNQALAIFRQAGDRKDEGHTLRQIGTVYDYRYDDTTALQFYQQALTIAREIADQPGEADALSSIGDAYTSLGQYVNALNAFEQGLPIARAAADRIAAAGDSLAVANVRETETLILARMAAVYQRQGQYPPALEIYQQALANAREPSITKRWRTANLANAK